MFTAGLPEPTITVIEPGDRTDNTWYTESVLKLVNNILKGLGRAIFLGSRRLLQGLL